MGESNIVIGFSTTSGFVSRAIRWLTRSKCSHAWILFNDRALGMHVVMQATWRGFELLPWKRWRRGNCIVAAYKPKINRIGTELALRLLAHELGRGYDYRSAFLVGLRGWWARWRKAKMTLRPSMTPHKLMCSEAVARMLKWAGFRLPTELNPELVSPGELMQWCEASSSSFRRIA